MTNIEIITRDKIPKIKKVQIQFKNELNESVSFTVRGTNDIKKVSNMVYFLLKDTLSSKEDTIHLIYKNLFKQRAEKEVENGNEKAN